MRITVDLDPKDVWRIQQKAEQLGITPGAVLREEIAQRKRGADLWEQVRELVLQGWCDADIAEHVGTPNNTIAVIRRRYQLPANKRKR